MKVLFVVPHYHPNFDGMVAGLHRAGHDVAFLVRQIAPNEEHREGVTVTKLPPGWAPRFILGFLRATRPDVVVARNAGRTGRATYLACRWLGIRYLLYVQYPTGYEAIGPVRRLRRALGLWPSHTINPACPAPDREVPGKTFDFLPFAMELGDPRAPRPAGQPLRVLTVGKLDQDRKNLVPIVRHLAPLMRAGRITLTIIGRRGPQVSPAYGALLAEIETQGVASAVRLLENLDYRESRRQYPEHDLFLLASSRERAAISPAEAMASGLAVVCGSDNGTNYFIVPGETGFVFPDGDFGAMAERIAWFAENLPELERMGRNGRRRIADEFSPDRYAQEFTGVVERRFGPPPPPAGRH